MSDGAGRSFTSHILQRPQEQAFLVSDKLQNTFQAQDWFLAKLLQEKALNLHESELCSVIEVSDEFPFGNLYVVSRELIRFGLSKKHNDLC